MFLNSLKCKVILNLHGTQLKIVVNEVYSQTETPVLFTIDNIICLLTSSYTTHIDTENR